MARISWSDKESGRYSSGLDRGVLIPGEGDSVAWLGLTNVSERHEGSDPEPVYVNGIKVLDVPHKPEFGATMTAFTYPEEFERYQGRESFYEGINIGEQIVDDVFHLSYRTMIDGGPDYLLHVLFNLTAVANDVERMTFAEEIKPSEFTWDLSSVPYVSPNGRIPPFSHLIIDSRYTNHLINAIEDRIYGDESSNGNINKLIDVLDKLDDINTNGELYYVDRGDGVWTILGPSFKQIEYDGVWTGQFEDAEKQDSEFSIYNLKEI